MSVAKKGTQVIVPFRGDQDSARHLKPTGDVGQIVPVRIDIKDQESLKEAVKYADAVYNLIGREYETMHYSFKDVHVDAARSIAQACAESENVERLIHVSSLNADLKSKSQYYKTKAEGEAAVRRYFPEAVIVRPAVMYGWEDRLLNYLGQVATHQVKRLFTAGFIPMVNGGSRLIHPVYVGDVARGLLTLSEREDVKSLYEFVGPKGYTYYEFVEMFCEYTRRQFFPLSVPYSVMRSVVSITQRSPVYRTSVHDVDRMIIDDTILPESGRFNELGVDPEELENTMIRFVRRFRSGEYDDEPATLAELKLYRRSKPDSN